MIETFIQFFFTFLVSTINTLGVFVSSIGIWLVKSSWLSGGANMAARRMMASSTIRPFLTSLKNTILYIEHGWKHPKFPMTKDILVMIIVVLTLTIWSAYKPLNWTLWVLNMFPVIIEIILLGMFFYKYPLTPILYKLFFFQICLTIIGSHYTYANFPMGKLWMSVFDLKQNYFDRVVQFLQGFVISIFIREILVRTSPLKKGPWVLVICSAMTLALMTIYQIIQGIGFVVYQILSENLELVPPQEIWSSIWGTLVVFAGACTALVSLSSFHQKQIAKLHTKLHSRTIN